MSCNHTTAVWQNCLEVTASGLKGIKSCSNTQEHPRPIITKQLCEVCGKQRTLARRGGIAERGRGSVSLSSIPELKTPTKTPESDENDSGYHSDTLRSDDSTNTDDRPLSPKTVAPQRRQAKQSFKQRNRPSSNTDKQAWRPNLKRDWSLEHDDRRDSLNSLLSDIGHATFHVAKTETANMDGNRKPSTQRPRKQRLSTLLHPSTPPPVETTGHAQLAVAFACPKVVDVKRSSTGLSVLDTPKIVEVKRSASQRKREREMLAAAAMLEKEASGDEHEHEHEHVERPTDHLLRKNCFIAPPAPATYINVEKPLPAQPQIQPQMHLRTIISVPPFYQPRPRRSSTLLHPSPALPLPLLRSTKSEPRSETLAMQRRRSVLHSSLSDVES